MNARAQIVVPAVSSLGELASRLAADSEGQVRREYCEMFDAAQAAARRRLYEPLTPEEHETNAALVESAQLCSEVIAAVWQSLHPRSASRGTIE